MTKKVSMDAMEETRLRAMECLADDFVAVFAVNLDKNEIEVLKSPEYFGDYQAFLPEKPTYDQVISTMGKNALHPQDKTRFDYAMSRASIISKMRNTRSFEVNYRTITDGKETHFQNRVIVTNAELGQRSIILGIKNVEEEAKQEMLRKEQTSIINKLMNDYDCIMHVDLENPIPTYYKIEDFYVNLINRWQGSKDFWSRLEHYAADVVYEDDREKFLESLNPEIITAKIKEDGMYFINYRAIINGEIEYYQMKIIGNLTSLGSIVVGIRNSDLEYRAAALKYEQSAIIAVLTSDYDCIGYVDLMENKIKFYKNSDEISEYIPGWDEEENFSECMKKFATLIKSKSEKKEFMDTAVPENLAKKIKKDGFFLDKVLLALGDKEIYYDVKVVPDASRFGCVVIGFVNSDSNTREEQRRHEIESLATARHEFLSRMSHDIRTPINGVIGMLEVAKRAIGDNEKLMKALENVDISAHHLFALVDDVLDMTRIESGSVALKNDSMDLRIMLDSFMSIAGGQLIGRDLNVVEEFGEIRHPFVISDELRIRQILLNIMNNAIKFTPDGGSIYVRAKEGDPVPGEKNKINYIFEIEDTGVGMSKDFVNHIFETFSQEKIGARTKYSGTGLGMSITKKYANMFGAKIEVDSRLDQGTRFTLTFPLEVDTERNAGPILPAEIPTEFITSLEGTRVMVVEDNDINMEIAHTLLEAEGAIITEAENGQVALDIFMDNPEGSFDAILMDIMMPIMDGLEATRRIRQSGKGDAMTIPIIALTANAFDEDRRKVLDAGMNAHLTKPLNMKTMVKTLTYYIVKQDKG